MADVLGLLAFLAMAAALLLALLMAMLVRGATRPSRRTTAYAVARNIPCDPGEAGLTYDDWLVDVGDGQLPVWEINSPEALYDVTTVHLHGWGQSRLNLLANLGRWTEWSRCNILYDLRGHGEASPGSSRLGCGEEADLLRVLDRVEQDRPVILVGHSLGAAIAIGAAASDSPHRRRISAVIAYGPYVRFRTSLVGQLRRRQLPVRPVVDLALGWHRLQGICHHPVDRLAASLQCPLLVLHGEEDDISPIADGRAIAAAAPSGRFESIGGASHGDVMSTDPDRHDRMIASFLRSVFAQASDDPTDTGA